MCSGRLLRITAMRPPKTPRIETSKQRNAIVLLASAAIRIRDAQRRFHARRRMVRLISPVKMDSQWCCLVADQYGYVHAF
jgi:hypothetical protein